MAHHEQDEDGQWWYCWQRKATGYQYRTRVEHRKCEGCGEQYLPTMSKKSRFCGRECAMRRTGQTFSMRGEDHPAWSGGRKITAQGYVRVWLSAEDRVKYGVQRDILEHRLVMAKKLGRPLKRNETVHHKNGNKQDNRLSNLELRVGYHGPGASEAHCATCSCFAS